MAVETKENPKFDKLAGELESWSILEIAKFGKFLQDRWGVSAAPVGVAAAPGAGGAGAAAAAELLQLPHLEAAVFGDDDRGRARELFRELVDGAALRRHAAALALHLWPGLDLRHGTS